MLERIPAGELNHCGERVRFDSPTGHFFELYAEFWQRGVVPAEIKEMTRLRNARIEMARRGEFDRLAADGVTVRHQAAVGVDTDRRTVALDDGSVLPYDRLVLAPGIDLDWDALPGYDASAAQAMPHAWRAGTQTLRLREQLRAMLAAMCQHICAWLTHAADRLN